MNNYTPSRIKSLVELLRFILKGLQKLLILLRIMRDPKKVHERKLKELIAWATAPVPEQEARYVILQPKGSYPYKVQYKPGITKISGEYEIKAYARTKEEAETKEAVFAKLWLDKKEPIDEYRY